MRIAIVGIHYPICSARYLADAFKRQGHDVRTLGFTPGNIWGMQYDPRWQWNATGQLTQHWDDWTPDLMVISESAWKYHHPSYTVPHVVFGADNHVRDYRQAGVERYFLAHKNVTVTPWSDDDCEWWPGSYDPSFMRPSPIPYEDREVDVCLIGVQYAHRTPYVEALVQSGVKVFASTGLFYTDYVTAYQQSRMALCISANGDVGQRIFENAVLGCLVLSDPLLDLHDLDARGIQVFEDDGQLVDIVQHYLQKPGLAQEQIALAQQWVIPFTWDNRAKRIVAWFNETYNQKETGKTDNEIQEIQNIAAQTVRL